MKRIGRLGRWIAVAAVGLAMAAGGVRADQRLGAGWLLFAAPTLSDPRFHHAVVLLADYGPHGGFGFLLNRPLAKGTMGALLDGLHLKDRGNRAMPVQVFAGGPVQPEQGFVVHLADKRFPDSTPLGGTGLAYTISAATLGAIAEGRGPSRYRLFFGYSGWEAGQLAAEVDRGDWRVAPMEPDDVFGTATDGLWARAWKRAGVPL